MQGQLIGGRQAEYLTILLVAVVLERDKLKFVDVFMPGNGENCSYLGVFEVGVDPGEHCKDKCSCLARPRLRLSDHVLWRVRQQCRQGCFLDWGGLSHGLARQSEEYLDFGGSIEAHCIDTLEQVGLQVELLKTFH